MILKRSFYLQNTLDVAKSILGCILVREYNNIIFKGKIVETEAYTQEDEACHAYKGITKRCETMFKKGGLAYVYFTYGMYHCFNVVTEKEGRGCAVLIRALEPISEITSQTNGPAKLCKAFNITRNDCGIDLTKSDSPLRIESGEKIDDKNIIQTTRIGITKATDYPWRFYIKDNKFISRK